MRVTPTWRGWGRPVGDAGQDVGHIQRLVAVVPGGQGGGARLTGGVDAAVLSPTKRTTDGSLRLLLRQLRHLRQPAGLFVGRKLQGSSPALNIHF